MLENKTLEKKINTKQNRVKLEGDLTREKGFNT